MSESNVPPIDQPSTSGGGGPHQNTAAYAMAPAPINTSNATNPQQYQQQMPGYPASMQQQVVYPDGYSYSQAPIPSYYYPQAAGQMPQRSPMPSGEAQMPPQIMVPRSDQQPQTISQHSPARRPMSGQPGWPPVDPNDPNAQHGVPPPHYPLPPHQMMTQQGHPPQMHGYPPQGMAPPPPSYYPPPHQRFGYPGQDPSMQPMMGHPSHPYYLQVPGQAYQNGPNNPNQPHMQLPPQVSNAGPQPVVSNANTDDEEAKRRLQAQGPPPTNMHLSPAGYPQQQMPPGMHRPMMHPHPPPMIATGQIPPYISTRFTHMLKPSQKEAVEKLVGVPSETIPAHTIPQRREFFEQLVLLNDEQGEQLSAPPQVSKSSIDLHRLYIAVRRKGGFEQVTKEKSWKALCTEANPRMTESSAAGYQLRRHYQRYLLHLECKETGRSAEELKQFAEKLKKKKKEKDEPGTPQASTVGPPTPNSVRSAATPQPSQQQPTQQPQPSPSTFSNVPPSQQAQHYPPPPMHGHPPYGAPPPAGTDPYYYQQQQAQHGMPPQQPMASGAGPMPPPGAWPGAYGYPPQQMRMPPTSGPPYYPPHPQQSATPMEYQPQPQQGLAAPPTSHSQQPPAIDRLDRPSSSMSGAGQPQAAVSSRPPSQAPQQQATAATTPDNRPQQQANEDNHRPSSRQPPPTAQRPGHTPTPTSSAAAMLGQPPPQAQGTHGAIPPANAQQPPYYGQQGYPPRMPPPGASASAKSPYPQPGYQGMEPPNFIPHHSAPPPHGMYPPPPAQHQPGMWPPPHHQPSAQHAAMNPAHPPVQRFGMPGKTMPGQAPNMAAPDFRRPQPPPGTQPPAPYFPAASNQQMPSPGSIQRSRHQQAPQPTTSSAHHHQQRHSSSQGSQFPPGSLEATAPKLALSRKRPRIFARDYAWAPQRRLIMSLRSGQMLEMNWALNALTALLYDDTQQPLRLDHTDPQLLSLLVEHLRATLAILYPEIDFNIDETDPTLDGVCEYGSIVEKVEKKENNKRQQMGAIVVKSLPANKLASTSDSSPAQNYTLKTRTDRLVKIEPAKKPEKLQRICMAQEKSEEAEKGANSSSIKKPNQKGTSFANRIYHNLQSRLNARRALHKPTYSLADRLKQKDETSNDDDGYNSDRENASEEQIGFFYRRNYEHEVWDRFGQPDCSLLPRPAPLNERDPVVQELVDRCLCLSNLIRGLAFVPLNCRLMHTHRALLSICSKLLMLCVKEDEQQKKIRKGEHKQETTKDIKLEPDTEPSKTNNNEEESMEVDGTEESKEKSKPSTIDDHFNADDSSKFRVKQCDPEQDSNKKLLLETANQLRDDAFIILSQLSVHLDLYNMEDDTSYPLLDALIHWAVTTNIQSQDPIHPSAISPRAYVFEIISKLSLLDKNIDLLLSTGSWPRLEEFVRVVCNCITMSEDLPLREFAIVILQAISVASEPVCIVATSQTQVIHNLISFIEVADQAMTTIASNDGLAALRDNTERIGTSIGMLRRAIQILYNFAQHEPCRPNFVRHQEKLLSFTVSSIMDSRVAITAASILYDIQNLPDDVPKSRELTEEDFKEMSNQFLSCNWRLNDTDEEPDNEPFPILNTDFQSNVTKDQRITITAPQLILPIQTNVHSGELTLNGIDSVAINGNSKPKRKRMLRHPDGTEMTALEQELLRDSDAESIEGDDEEDRKHSTTINNDHSLHTHHHHETKRTVSESVKEKLHNHILKHEHAGDAVDPDEPEAKKQRLVGNGVISPKCNGDLNNKTRPSQASNQQQNKPENGTPTPKNSSGSMTAVA